MAVTSDSVFIQYVSNINNSNIPTSWSSGDIRKDIVPEIKTEKGSVALQQVDSAYFENDPYVEETLHSYMGVMRRLTF